MQRLNGFLALVLGLAASAFAFYWLRRPAEPGPPPQGRGAFVLPVTMAAVERGTLAPTAALTGTVRSARRAQVAFNRSGRIVEVAAADGDRVEQGQLLARLEDGAEQLALARARRNLELAELEYERSEAGERSEVISRLSAEVQSAEAALTIAELDVERGRELLANNILSAATQDTNIATRDGAAGRLDAARQALAEAEAGTRADDLAIALARVEVARADLELAAWDLADMRATAPWSGAVVERLLDAGDYATPGAAVFDLVDLDHFEVELEVPAGLGAALKAGAAVELTVDDGGPLSATIDVVAPVADPVSRNFRVLVRLERDDPGFERLVPGQFARASIALEPIADTLLVPQDAIRQVDGGEILVVAEPIPGAEPPTGPPTGPPSPWLQAAWIPVRRLGTADGICAVVSLGPPLDVGVQAVMTGVDRAFPGAALMPAGGGPPAPSPPSAGDGGSPPEAESGAGSAGEQS